MPGKIANGLLKETLDVIQGQWLQVDGWEEREGPYGDYLFIALKDLDWVVGFFVTLKSQRTKTILMGVQEFPVIGRFVGKELVGG